MAVKSNDKALWTQFNGLSDSISSGPKGSFYKMVGLDCRSQPGLVTSQQKLTKDSGATIDALCRVGLALSDGSYLFFSSTTGKIWRTTGNGTYTLVYTTVPTSGGAGCLGAHEYNGNVYWATQNYLHYVALANVSSFAGVTANWQLFSVTNATYHPMCVQAGILFIGDGNKVASVNSSGTWSETAGTNSIDFLAPVVITTMVAYDQDIAIGTIISTGANYAWIFRWDGTQSVATYSEPVREAGIYALMWYGNLLIANCGVYGRLYQYDGRYLIAYKRIPGNGSGWSPSNTANILPNSYALVQGVLCFGLSQVSGTPCDFAVYGIGSYSQDYAPFMSEDYPISTGNTQTAITIGALVGDGLNLYVAWQDGTSYGVDKLDYGNKYASGYLETTRVTPEYLFTSSFPRLFAAYQSMPASTSLTFKYYPNNATSSTVPTNSLIDESTNHVHVYVDEGINEVRTLRMRLEFNVTANNAPTVEALGFTIT